VSGTASPVTITFTNNAQYSYTFAVTATLGASTLTSATSASVQSANPINTTLGLKFFYTFDSQVNSTGGTGTGYFPNKAPNANNTSNSTDLIQVASQTFVITSTSKFGTGCVRGYHRINMLGSYTVPLTGCSWCLWANIITTQNNLTLTGWDSTQNVDGAEFILTFTNSNALKWITMLPNTQNGSTSTSTGTITTNFTNGTWNHIAITFSSVASYGATSTCCVYLNGSLTSTLSATYFDGNAVQYWDIGSYPGASADQVYIDSYRYYERALSAADVSYIYSTKDATNLA